MDIVVCQYYKDLKNEMKVKTNNNLNCFNLEYDNASGSVLIIINELKTI